MGITQHPLHIDTDSPVKGLIEPYFDAFKQYLAQHGYAAHTSASYVVDIAHFARWVRTKRLRLNSVNEASVAEFLDEHLPNCQCAAPVRHDRSDHRAALGHLLVVLRSLDAIAPAALSATPVDEELHRYDEYMEHARGLVPKTRSMALSIIGRLLTERFGSGAINIGAITPEQVRRFFAQEALRYSNPSSLGSVVASLRGYFRYHVSLGDHLHGGLTSAIAYPANWKQSTLPKTLTTEEVAQLVNALGQPGPSMRRADAIVRCALDLGLRSGEIARLSLDDIDWRASTLTLRHTKGGREDLLPLPATTGAAIAAYLKQRPRTTNRAIFVRLMAPLDQPVGPDLVRKTIRQAYARAALPYTRSHLLRHTMANRLLAGGSSLKEVADVLRHRSLNTTMIYAKLDSRNLAAVALPWPGSAA
ncbi:MAG: tyrosine-type recombinase/integrase [Rhodoferax sp.]|nr:tyrosine-type recombinase/integrase [Rhodoferax sp.]